MPLCHVIHNKSNPYLTINTTIANDDRLSWKAKGIWLCILSKKDNRQFCEEDLIEGSKESIASLHLGLKELEDYGYLSKSEEAKS